MAFSLFLTMLLWNKQDGYLVLTGCIRMSLRPISPQHEVLRTIPYSTKGRPSLTAHVVVASSVWHGIRNADNAEAPLPSGVACVALSFFVGKRPKGAFFPRKCDAFTSDI